MLYKKGNITKAIELIEEAVKNYQNNPNYYNTLGLIYESVRKNTEAASAYNKAISIDKAYYEAYHNLAILFQSQGHYSKAVDNCRQAISIKPDFDQEYNTLAFSLEKQGFYGRSGLLSEQKEFISRANQETLPKQVLSC